MGSARVHDVHAWVHLPDQGIKGAGLAAAKPQEQQQEQQEQQEQAGAVTANKQAAAGHTQQQHAAQGGAQTNDDAAYLAVVRQARTHISSYAHPHNWHGVWSTLLTWALWLASLGVLPRIDLAAWWAPLVLPCWMFVRAGSYVRAFVLFHDFAHFAVFSSKRANVVLGTLTGLLVGTDYFDYRTAHNAHHSDIAIKEQQDAQSTIAFSTKDWAAWPASLSKLAARILWDPLVLYPVGGPVFMLVGNTCWPGLRRDRSAAWRVLYPLSRCLLLPAYVGAVACTLLGGFSRLLMLELATMFSAMAYAMFLFHIQHVFEGTYRGPRGELNRTAAIARGSSYLYMPWWWRWATLGIEYHAIHHMNARVPCYRIQACYEAAPAGMWEAVGMPALGAREACHAMLLTVWDPDRCTYVPFKQWQWLADRIAPSAHARPPCKQA